MSGNSFCIGTSDRLEGGCSRDAQRFSIVIECVSAETATNFQQATQPQLVLTIAKSVAQFAYEVGRFVVMEIA